MKIYGLKKVELNITELCNLKCGFCPRSTFYPNRNLNMSLATAETVAKQIMDYKVDSGYNPIVILSGRGEPTLHPQFDKLFNIFYKHKLDIGVVTNGKRLDQYIDTISKCKFITYDVYSENEEDFFDAIYKIKNLPIEHKLVQLKPEDGSLKEAWRNGKFDLIKYDYILNRAGSLDKKYENLVTNKKSIFCKYVEESIFIDWNGDYNLCCNDWKPKPLSNICRQDIKTYIMKNKYLQDYKNGIRSSNRLSPCDTCSV